MRQHTENEYSCLNFTVIALCSSHSFQETKYSPGAACVLECVVRKNLRVQVPAHEYPPACVHVNLCVNVCVFLSAH